MKIKNLFQLLGMRGRSKKHLYRVTDYALKNGAIVKYARWLHPSGFAKEFSEDLVEAYGKILRPGDFCIDIGAFSGDTTLPMALAVGPTGFTLALEPNPFVYHVLEKNARANRALVRIETMMAAAAPRECILQFEYSDAGYCNGGRHEGINPLLHGHAYRLDVFGIDLSAELRACYADVLPRLRYIKVDAEGFDLYVIQSLQEIIQEFRPYVKAEVFKNSSAKYRTELFEIFLKLGYSIYKVDEEPFGTGSQLGLADVNSWQHYDILAVPGER